MHFDHLRAVPGPGHPAPPPRAHIIKVLQNTDRMTSCTNCQALSADIVAQLQHRTLHVSDVLPRLAALLIEDAVVTVVFDHGEFYVRLRWVRDGRAESTAQSAPDLADALDRALKDASR